MAVVFFITCICALVYGIYSLIYFLGAINNKEASEETKALWKKKCLIASAAFVISIIGNIIGNEWSSYFPELTPEERAARMEKQRLEIAARDAQRAEEAKKAKQEQEEAALQKKYDDQKKYEEWLEWKKQEANRQAQKAEEERKAALISNEEFESIADQLSK